MQTRLVRTPIKAHEEASLMNREHEKNTQQGGQNQPGQQQQGNQPQRPGQDQQGGGTRNPGQQHQQEPGRPSEKDDDKKRDM